MKISNMRHAINWITVLGLAFAILLISSPVVIQANSANPSESHLLQAQPLQASNHRPQITSQPVTTVFSDQVYTYDVDATDPDGDAITFSLDVAPSGMTIDPNTGLITWTVGESQIGTKRVRVIATDSTGLSTSQRFSIDIISTTPKPPRIISTPVDMATQGQLYTYDVDATDPNGDTITYSLSPDFSPKGMTIDPNTGVIQWTPTKSQTGTRRIIVIATDSTGLSDDQRFVIRMPQPPIIISEPVTNAIVNRLYTYGVNAFDPEGDPLTFSLEVAPSGMTIDPNTGLILWTPTPPQAAIKRVRVKVTDSTGLMSVQNFSIVVEAEDSQSPHIISIPVATGTVAQLYTYDVDAADPNGDTLTFSLSGEHTPNGMTIDPNTGVIQWTPSASQVGNNPVRVIVRDTTGRRGFQNFVVNIKDHLAGQPPRITSSPVLTGLVGQLYSYDVEATDPDAGGTLSFSLDSAPPGMTIDAVSGLVQWTPAQANSGDNAVTVRVEDGTGLADTQSFTIAVQVVVPDVVGLAQANAEADITASNLVVGAVTTSSSNTVPAGDVISQNPPAGTTVAPGTSVSIVVSTGSSQITIPDLTGLTHLEAKLTLEALGLVVGTITSRPDSTFPFVVLPGQILSQNPQAGTSASAGDAVDIELNEGHPAITPPISFTVDTSVTPVTPQVPPFSDGVPRPVASVVDESGNQADFVQNEMVLITNDQTLLNAFLSRWNGILLDSVDPSTAGFSTVPSMHLIRVDTSLADPAAMVGDLRGFRSIGMGQHRLSSQEGLELLAGAYTEVGGGVEVGLNWLTDGHQFIDSGTAEGASMIMGVIGPFGGTFDTINALANSPSNGIPLLGVNSDTNELLQIAFSSGAATRIGGGSIGFAQIDGLAFDPNANVLYGSDTFLDGLISINPGTGGGTFVGGLGFGDVQGLAYDTNSNTLYGVDADTDQLITIDPATGIGTAVGPLGMNDVMGLAYHTNFNMLFGSIPSTNQLVTINRNTGQAAPFGTLGGRNIQGLGVEVATNILFGTDVDNDVLISMVPRYRGNETPTNLPYSNDAFTWPHIRQGGPQDIGVGDAWRALEQTGNLNSVDIMVLDGGFAPNVDFPTTTAFGALNVPNPGSCGGNPCPWHGTDVVTSGMALPDNGAGVAGPGGPVARAIVIPSPDVTFWTVITLFIEYQANVVQGLFEGPEIVNMSFGVKIPAGVCLLLVCKALDDLASTARVAGILLIASAGNNNRDVDAQDCFIVCWEETVFTPCELDDVMCVGGLEWNSRSRAATAPMSGSNFGSDPTDCCTVDIYAPYRHWVFDPGTTAALNPPSVRLASGTSFSAPFTAGIAALIWAADPSLGATDVENILMNTAHTGSPDPSVPRWVDAFAGTIAALPDAPPTVNILVPQDMDTISRGLDTSFIAGANDREDGPISSVTWTSDIDGVFGSQNNFTKNDLSFGRHNITASVTDSSGFSEFDSVVVNIVNDQPPVMTITSPIDRATFLEGAAVLLQGTSFDQNNPPSFDLPDSAVTWHIDQSGTPFATGHSFNTTATAIGPGVHPVLIRGIDDAGGESFFDTDLISVTINPLSIPPGVPPTASITSPADGDRFSAVEFDPPGLIFGVDVDFTGNGIDIEDTTVADGRLVWAASRNGGPESTIGVGPSITARLLTEGIDRFTQYTITLYATDSDGHVSSDSIDITIAMPDNDGDGLTLGEERVVYGTDPFNPESDGDGVEDGAEVVLGFSPTSPASVPTEIPDGSLFATSGGIGGAHLAIIDPNTGALGRLGQPNGPFGFGVAFDAHGFLFAARGGDLVIYDPLPQTVDVIGSFQEIGTGTPVSIITIAYNPADGMLYGVEEGPAPNFLPTDQLLQIDPFTAEVTRIGSAGDPINSLTFTRDGVLYAALQDTTSDRLVELDPTTAAILQEVGPIDFMPVLGMTIDASGTIFASHFIANDQSDLLTIDSNTGLGTPVATVFRSITDLTVMPCPAPCFTEAPDSPFAASSPFDVIIDSLSSSTDANLDMATVGLEIGLASVAEIFLGDGAGDFTNAPDITSLPPLFFGAQVSSKIAHADINNDGFIDLVFGMRAAQETYVYLGDGSGNFALTAGSPLAMGGVQNSLSGIALGDVTGNGFLDVVGVVNSILGGNSVVVVYEGDGTGNFAGPINFPIGVSSNSLTLGDINHDTVMDIITTNFDVGTEGITVLLMDGSGGLLNRIALVGPITPGSAKVADIDRDGSNDIVLSDLEADSIGTFEGDGTGGFSAYQSFSIDGNPTEFHGPGEIEVKDVSGDGRLDAITANFDSISVLIGDGHGGFRPATRSEFTTSNNGGRVVDLGDLNNDGLLDLATAGGNAIAVLLNNPSF